MKYILLFASLLLLTNTAKSQTKCDIVNIYSIVEPKSGVKCKTNYNGIEEVDYFLVPTTIPLDKYEVSLSREESNFYRIIGKDLMIETRTCYEYANYDDAILVIDSNYGYTRGEIIFTE